MKRIVTGFLLLVGLTAQAQKRPNIILLMADDLGWGDTGYNGNPVIRTPSLDQMAKEGIQFNRFYSACSVCSPTRASVLTGRNPYRSGVFDANVGILRPEEITLPELLKEEGYVTGHFGKWHLGTLTHTERDGNRGRPGNTREYNPPVMHGYDNAFVTECKVPTYDPMKKPLERSPGMVWDYIKEGEGYTHYGSYYWDIEGKKVTTNLDGDDSRVIMDRVLPFIEKSAEHEKPFLAVVWFHTPHRPLVAGPKYQAMYREQDLSMRNYAGSITAMDEQIGRLRDFLKEKGLESNTMIWFCSDNGPRKANPGSTGIFSGAKRSLLEGGVRVPGILVWPQMITDGFETEIPCVTSDYLPTIVDVLNIDENKILYQLDGVSLLPLLQGRMRQRPKPIGFCFIDQVSCSDNKYKLYAENGNFKLYDIVKDPSEAEDLKRAKPAVFRKMRKRLSKFVASCHSSFKGNEYGTESCNRLEQDWVDPMQIVENE